MRVTNEHRRKEQIFKTVEEHVLIFEEQNEINKMLMEMYQSHAYSINQLMSQSQTSKTTKSVEPREDQRPISVEKSDIELSEDAILAELERNKCPHLGMDIGAEIKRLIIQQRRNERNFEKQKEINNTQMEMCQLHESSINQLMSQYHTSISTMSVEPKEEEMPLDQELNLTEPEKEDSNSSSIIIINNCNEQRRKERTFKTVEENVLIIEEQKEINKTLMETCQSQASRISQLMELCSALQQQNEKNQKEIQEIREEMQ